MTPGQLVIWHVAKAEEALHAAQIHRLEQKEDLLLAQLETRSWHLTEERQHVARGVATATMNTLYARAENARAGRAA